MGRAEVRAFLRQGIRASSFLKERIERGASAKIISHRDADGVASAFIMSK
jgi:single-stranded DNA-specific DHH superfamily exonuclease